MAAAALLSRRERSEPFLSDTSVPFVGGSKYTATVGERQFMFVLGALAAMDFADFEISRPPPVSITDVVRLSEPDLIRYVPAAEIDEWLAESVALTRCPKDTWYFSAVFRPSVGGLNPGGTPRRVEIPVLFNRMVVKGVELSRGSRPAETFIEQAALLGLPAEHFFTAEQKAACNVALLQDIAVLSSVEGAEYAFSIPSQSLENSGDYDLAKSPPLGFDGAVVSASKALSRYVSEEHSERWQVVKVALIRWGNSRKWYYLVEFGRADADAARLRIPVLLSGEAVGGKRL